MSPKDQQTMEQLYAFYALQDELLKADKRSAKVRREMRTKMEALMRLANSLKRNNAMRYNGGVDPVVSAQEVKVLVAA